MPSEFINDRERITALESQNQDLQAALARVSQCWQDTVEELQTVKADLDRLQKYRSESEKFLHLAINHIPEPIFWKDLDSVFLGCNQYFAQFAGLNSPSEIIGKTDYDLPWKREETEKYRADDRRIMESDTPELKLIETIEQENGSYYWVETNKIPLHDQTGKVVGILGTFLDVTDRVLAEQKLQKLNQDLEQQVTDRTKTLEATQARLQRLADNLPGLIFQFRMEADGTYSFPYVSEASRNLYGLEPDDFIKVFDYVDPRDLPSLQQAIEESRRLLTGFHHEHRIVTTQGKKKWVQAILRPEQQEDGAVVWDGMIIEISDRKQTEERLRQQEVQYRQIFETVTDGLAIVDLEAGKLVQINRAFYQMYGYEYEEFMKLSVMDFIHPETMPLFGEFISEIKAGRSFTCVGMNVDRQGNVIEVEVKGIPYPYQEKTHALAILRDISERKRQERALRSIVEGTASQTGAEFFRSCVQCIALALEVSYAFIVEVDLHDPEPLATVIACWEVSDFGQTFEYNLRGTPCLNVIQNQSICCYPRALQEQFPDDQYLVNIGAESYLGIPILNSEKKLLGFIAVLDTKPIEKNIELQASILKIFAARAGAELERMKAEKRIEKQAQHSELLNQIANQIRTSLDLDQIIHTTVCEIQRFLEIDRTHFAWYVEEADQAYWHVIAEVAIEGIPNLIGKHPVANFGAISELLLSQEIVKIDDIYTVEDRATREILMALGSQSILVLPIGKELDRLGVISCMQSQKVRPWRTHEVNFLEAVVAQVAIALQQANLLSQSQSRAQELERLLEQLKWTQTQLIQSEKMSGLGQMVAGVAHEINNPVNFIHGNIIHAQTYSRDLMNLIRLYQCHYPQPHPEIEAEIEAIDLEFIQEDCQKIFHSMQVGTNRIRDIVQSLRTFSRLDESELKAVDLHEGIDSTLSILNPRLRAISWRSEIEVIKDYGQLPLVECYARQLNQVFMNILTNAIDALEEKEYSLQSEAHPGSKIWIETREVGENVVIRIMDNGLGMSEETQRRLFDPFYTTKPVGKGTGLGLSVSYQIVTEKHRGSLSCISAPGKTTFRIEIPILHIVARGKESEI